MAETKSQRLEKWARRIAIPIGIGAGLLIGNSCKNPTEIEPPPVNYSPQTTFSINPLEGYAPLSIRIQYQCTDKDGVEDITKSYIVVGPDTIRTKSLDSMFTFTQPGTLEAKAYCEDKEGKSSSAGPMNIVVSQAPQPQPTFTQSVTPLDSFRIRYNASMENLNSAKVRVLKNGAVFDSMTISTSPFTKTYDTHGNYTFISDIPGLKPDTVTAALTDYDVKANLSSIPADSLSMNEGTPININLKSRIENSDPNKEDNPVTIDGVIPRDNKVSVSQNGYDLVFNPVGDSTGNWKVDIVLKNKNGKKTTETIQQGQIYDLPHFRGSVEDGRNPGVGTQATLVAYKVVGSDTVRLQTTTSTSDTMNITDANGNFDFKINKRSADLEKIILMARLGVPGNHRGGTRVIDAPAKDTSGILMSCATTDVPFDDFVKFMYEVTQADATFWPPRIRFDLKGEYVPGFNGLQRIRVLDHGYFGDSTTIITPDQQLNIKSKKNDVNDIAGIAGPDANFLRDSVQVVFGNDTTDYIVSAVSPDDPLYPVIGNWKITPRPGVIVIAPKTNMPYSGLTIPQKVGASLVTGGVIYLKGAGNNTIISHEFTRILLGLGNNMTLDPSQTVMWASGNTLTTTGPADKDAGWILYNPTYMTTLPQFAGDPSLDMLGNILRPNFK